MRGSAARGQRPASDVLAELRTAAKPLRISELAERLGVHPNTVRFHLSGLIQRGQVECVEAAPTGPGRPARLFRAVPGMDPSGPRHYRMLAEVLLADLAAHPQGGTRAVAAGRAWGTGVAAGLTDPVAGNQTTLKPEDASDRTGSEAGVQRLIELMDGLGFAPEAPMSGDQIRLRHCPFLELAHQHPQVCQVHLGLAQGVLTAWRAPLTAERMLPFAEPDRCVIELRQVEPQQVEQT